MSTAPDNEVVEEPLVQAKPPFLRRVQIRGYKSIAFCDVTLEPLTILVGRNASGKSNFLDALAFVKDAMETNITEATKRHGGWHSVLSRFATDNEITIEFELTLPSESSYPPEPPPSQQMTAKYGFVLREGPSDSPVLVREWFGMPEYFSSNNPCFQLDGSFDLTQKAVKYTWDICHPELNNKQVPRPHPDRLWIGSFNNQPFLNVSDGLRFSECYNFHPQSIRRPQMPTPGRYLERDGSNLASVIETTREIDEWAIERAGDYLSAITTTVGFGGVVESGGYETLRFRVTRDGDAEPLQFPAASMSDGTLRAFAALVAAFQMALPHGSPSLVAIEEPETSLHPAAMHALVDALDEATLRTQILLTSHSAEMLDNPTIKPENVRVVQLIDGKTVIGPVDEASVEIVKRRLNTLGGLERENQLEPDLDDLDRQRDLARGQDEGRP
jgi:predicted ATPase